MFMTTGKKYGGREVLSVWNISFLFCDLRAIVKEGRESRGLMDIHLISDGTAVGQAEGGPCVAKLIGGELHASDRYKLNRWGKVKGVEEERRKKQRRWGN